MAGIKQSSTTARAPADEVLVITRVFDAPRELVFKLWTDPDHAVNWWGPRDYPAADVHMDVRPGGAWRGCLRSPETGKELWHGGVFREVVPPSRPNYSPRSGARTVRYRVLKLRPMM